MIMWMPGMTIIVHLMILALLLQELVMDILRVLTAPDLEVRKKTLSFALELVSSRNIEEVFVVYPVYHYHVRLLYSYSRAQPSAFSVAMDNPNWASNRTHPDVVQTFLPADTITCVHCGYCRRTVIT
jgi:hypothetical protein